MEPLVSILIPAFNAERWIADAIKSALEQTWPQKEIIVVDDGSTDQTPSIARQFVSKSVSVITQSNQGAASARNKAFSTCQGGYIQWLDADDLLAPSKIAKQMELWLAFKVNALFSLRLGVISRADPAERHSPQLRCGGICLQSSGC